MVPFTELVEEPFRYSEQFCRAFPSPGSLIGSDNLISFFFGIMMCQIFRDVRVGFIKAEIFFSYRVACGMEGSEKNGILQLPDIAGPRMQLQCLYCRRVKSFFRVLFLLGILCQKIVGDVGYILCRFSQRWHNYTCLSQNEMCIRDSLSPL